MQVSEKFTTEELFWTHHWAEHLFSFRITRPSDYDFVAGQFARLGLPAAHAEESDEIVWRPYSVVSPTAADYLEFCSVIVPGGAFTTALARQAIGARVLLDRTAFGFLTTERLAPGGDLWMLATGTGLAPYVSILAEPANWHNYRNLVVVHSVRFEAELAYRDTICALPGSQEPGQARAVLHYVPIVTREASAGALTERIPALLQSGALENRVGCALTPQQARVLICGNPEMVREVRAELTLRGFAPSRRGQAGTLAVENYW